MRPETQVAEVGARVDQRGHDWNGHWPIQPNSKSKKNRWDYGKAEKHCERSANEVQEDSTVKIHAGRSLALREILVLVLSHGAGAGAGAIGGAGTLALATLVLISVSCRIEICVIGALALNRRNPGLYIGSSPGSARYRRGC